MWSRKHACCVKCSRIDRKHFGKGLCSYCYMNKYCENPENKARIDKQKHDYYVRNGGKALSKIQRELRWFDGKRDSTLERVEFVCQECGTTEQLVVHHEDGNGRGAKQPNNADDNLTVLCRGCHARHHRSLNGRWSIRHDACIRCKSTERKHNARGLCWQCYPIVFPTTKKLFLAK